jgi:hypothetical protein
MRSRFAENTSRNILHLQGSNFKIHIDLKEKDRTRKRDMDRAKTLIKFAKQNWSRWNLNEVMWSSEKVMMYKGT